MARKDCHCYLNNGFHRPRKSEGTGCVNCNKWFCTINQAIDEIEFLAWKAKRWAHFPEKHFCRLQRCKSWSYWISVEPVGHGIGEERYLSAKRELCLAHTSWPDRRIFSLLSPGNLLIPASRSVVQYCASKTTLIFLCYFNLTNIETQFLLFEHSLRKLVTCSIFWMKEVDFVFTWKARSPNGI